MRITKGSVAAAVVVTTGLLAMIVGCAPIAETPPAQPAPSAPVVEPGRLNTSSLSLLSQTITPPASLSVPDLGIDMPVDGYGLSADGQMALPVSPFRAGWYLYGSAPDSLQGATVVAAHVDSRSEGRGPFSRLRDAQAGMVITVTDTAGVVHTYRVTGIERIAKTDVPWDQVFSAVGEPRLVLVTCGGEWNRQAGSYRHNYVVTAEKVS